MLRVVDDCVRLARRTTADRMAAHRKLDRRRDDLCADGLRKPCATDAQLHPLTAPIRPNPLDNPARQALF